MNYLYILLNKTSRC